MSPNNEIKVRIRMYRQGLGDCFLLTFFPESNPAHVLIDCGTLGATTTGMKLPEVVADIAATTGRHLHLLVVTHEHKDHVLGFANKAKLFEAENGNPRFRVDEVWTAWTENPNDPLALQVKRWTKDLLTSVNLAADVLSQALTKDHRTPAGEQLALREVVGGVRELLGYYGEVSNGDALLSAKFAETVHEAMSSASMRSGRMPEFLYPGRVVEPAWLPGVRFYVLGPPYSQNDLLVLGTHESPELYHLTRNLGTTYTRYAPFHSSRQSIDSYLYKLDEDDPAERTAFEADLPFDRCFRIESNAESERKRLFKSYDEHKNAWRRIDYDWLAAADSLALNRQDIVRGFWAVS